MKFQKRLYFRYSINLVNLYLKFRELLGISMEYVILVPNPTKEGHFVSKRQFPFPAGVKFNVHTSNPRILQDYCVEIAKKH